LLVTIGKARFSDSQRHLIPFVNDIEQDKFLNDIENTPHAFVLACLMDRQIKSERAWSIPFRIREIIGSFKIDDLASVSLEEYKNILIEMSCIDLTIQWQKCFILQFRILK